MRRLVKKKCLWLVIGIFGLFLLAACRQQNKTTTTTEKNQISSSTTTVESSQEESQVEKLLQQMTLEEKVGQLFLARVPEEGAIEDLQNYHLGGYLLFDRDMAGLGQADLKQKIAEFQENSPTPLFIASDEEGGTVSRLSRNKIVSPPFENPQELYQKDGFDGIVRDIDRKAAIFNELGIQLGMSPNADVSTDPESFIYDRTIGLDAAGTSEYVAKSVGEMSKEKIGSTLKHFPGYGNNRDSHTEIVTDERSLEELQTTDFQPFIAGIQAGADSILVSHNIVNGIDSSQPASISPAVHEILRDQLNFKGVIMTDDMDMAGLAEFISQEEAGLKALQAGNDLILSSSYQTQIPYVIQAIQNGQYSEDALNQSVLRILNWKEKLGLIS